MHAFSVSRTVTVHDAHGQRCLPAALAQDAGGGLDPACVVLAIHDADTFARRALEALPADPTAPASTMRFYPEADLVGWPGWPMRLGRPDPAVPDTAGLMAEPMPLPGQLAHLRARSPHKRRFRIAFVGGFGYNLGDTLLGTTAWRLALPLIQATLPEVAADVLLGPVAGRACASLLASVPGIGEIGFRPPTLQDFSRYDAYFDFTGLIGLPRFHDGAAIDWILWWLGLDPTTIPAAEKRNRLSLTADALAWAETRLASVPGPHVGFVWRASTALRSMPDDTAVQLASDLLALVPDLTVVTERRLGLDHPRLLDLGSEATSAERMMALVARVDGLVSIDSLALHVADTADVPCLLLLNTLPPERFPYYPGTRTLVPNGMEGLPGWGVTKVADEVWEVAQTAYATAWSKVSATEVWSGLAERMALRPPLERRGSVVPCLAPRPSEEPFPNDRPTDLTNWINREILRLAAAILRPGATAVLASGGELALTLARQVSPGGALHILEPRRLRAQALMAEAQGAGLTCLHLWPALAGDASRRTAIPDLDPASEADPAAWGNLARTVPASMTPLDALTLAECQLLALRPPQDVLTALKGAETLLDACRPMIVAGPVNEAALPSLRNVLEAHAYVGWTCWPSRSAVDAALILAAPREANAHFEGFTRL